ncbi:MAG: flagellar FliJ family protein [Sulfuricurvum sp.]|uniref:flagellar FliJ family protein n=1 Tax=Sulfuricurvum sp. TaxID=2025608 RepID=UPI0026184964|nr:flagellar FliJ family protein [Sulfuricurvum sp.]MDD2828034.1 flagellar FliJ family protein [Sulfuricurvum sp.]MDD4948089.1 flagellar FliJ family protein [Sulfuricurvum sp.]
MKSKYTPLVKLKKKELDRVERDLIAANNRIKLATKLCEEAYMLLQSLSLPTSGSISEFTQAQMLFQAQHQEIENCNLNLAKAQHYQLLIQQQFKEAMIEYEKFKYLEMQELQAHSAKIKKEEAKMLDEIGVMTHKREPL